MTWNYSVYNYAKSFTVATINLGWRRTCVGSLQRNTDFFDQLKLVSHPKIGNATGLFETVAKVNLLRNRDEDNAYYKRNLSEKSTSAIIGGRKKNPAKLSTRNPMIPNLEADQTAACCKSRAKSKHAREMFRVAVLSTGGRQLCNSCGQYPPQRGHPIFEFPPVTE